MTRRPIGFLIATVTLALAGEGWAQPSARWEAWPKSRPPRPLPAQQVPFPPYQVRTLPNGLTVVAVPHHEQPAVTLRLVVGAGSAQDAATKPGVANMVGLLLDQGTGRRTASQIADTIDDIGGALATGAGTDVTFASCVVMKDSLDLAFDLVADVARHPSFEPGEIERQREQVLSGLKVGLEDPDYLAGTVIDRLVYGFHPYGQPSNGTAESLVQVTRDDLVTFHRDWFAPNNALLAVVGDVTADDAFAGALKAFGSWERRELPAQRFVEPPPPTRRIVVIDRPGSVQTEIRIANLGIPRKHPDYLPLDLAIRVLGGEGANRLQQVLRSRRSLTYSAEADPESLKQAGSIVAQTETRSEATGEALRLAVDEIWRLQREPVYQDELSGAQDYLTGNFPLTIETPDAIALQVLNMLVYGLDLKLLDTFRDRVKAVTVDDVQRVARAYLHPSRLSIVLVGDAAAIGPQLKASGFPEFEVIPADQLDLTSANLRRTRPAPADR